jgi:endonuclease/exonuclease/phosphatase family metal-dependent hydrolase
MAQRTELSTVTVPVVPVPNRKVRVLSWNLDSFQHMAYPDRIMAVFGPGYRTRFDLIATMETGHKNYEHLRSHLDEFDSYHGNKQAPNPYKQGQAIYWRRSVFEHKSEHTVALTAKGVTVIVRLIHKPTNRSVVVVAVHLKSWPTQGDNCQTLRDAQVSKIMLFLKTYLTPTDMLVVMGDWNEPASIGNVDRFKDRFGLTDVYGSITGSHPDDSTMIDQPWLVDHALVGSGLDTLDVYPTGKDRYTFGPDVTDHFPLRFDFRMHPIE